MIWTRARFIDRIEFQFDIFIVTLVLFTNSWMNMKNQWHSLKFNESKEKQNIEIREAIKAVPLKQRMCLYILSFRRILAQPKRVKRSSSVSRVSGWWRGNILFTKFERLLLWNSTTLRIYLMSFFLVASFSSYFINIVICLCWVREWGKPTHAEIDCGDIKFQ